jgi:hypothetical protein
LVLALRANEDRRFLHADSVPDPAQKRTLLFALLLGAAAFAFGEGNKFGIGLDGTIVNSVQTQNSFSDYSSSYLSLRVLVRIPISATSELTPFGTIILASEKDPSGLVTTAGTDRAQTAFGGGLQYLSVFASTGPFSVLSGLEGAFTNWGTPKGYTGTYSDLVFGLNAPLVLDIAAANNWSIRVTQEIYTISYDAWKSGTSSGTSLAYRFNTFNPSVGFFFSF